MAPGMVGVPGMVGDIGVCAAGVVPTTGGIAWGIAGGGRVTGGNVLGTALTGATMAPWTPCAPGTIVSGIHLPCASHAITSPSYNAAEETAPPALHGASIARFAVFHNLYCAGRAIVRHVQLARR
ncbi:MAG: hypothetical protein H7345_06560, partial [Rubritepida sp.]|nr:hypothetical protein [Rubritepida sp.]